jgi:hypothetical protein
MIQAIPGGQGPIFQWNDQGDDGLKTMVAHNDLPLFLVM